MDCMSLSVCLVFKLCVCVGFCCVFEYVLIVVDVLVIDVVVLVDGVVGVGIGYRVTPGPAGTCISLSVRVANIPPLRARRMEHDRFDATQSGSSQSTMSALASGAAPSAATSPGCLRTGGAASCNAPTSRFPKMTHFQLTWLPKSPETKVHQKTSKFIKKIITPRGDDFLRLHLCLRFRGNSSPKNSSGKSSKTHHPEVGAFAP